MALELSDAEDAGAEIEIAQRPRTVPTLVDIIDDVTAAGAAEFVSVRDVIQAFGGAGFPPILLIPALAVATPLSGIPLLTSVMGFIIFLVASQMLLGRDKLWLPQWILNRQVRGQIVAKCFGFFRRPAGWLDDRMGKRLSILVRRPFVFVPQLICLSAGAVMPLMEFIPFSSTVLGVSVGLLALGMLTRDGVIILLGLMPPAVVAALLLGAM